MTEQHQNIFDTVILEHPVHSPQGKITLSCNALWCSVRETLDIKWPHLFKDSTIN